VRLLLIADTHIPKRARDLPPEVWAEVDRVDLVIHAGDWVDLDTLDRLELRSERMVGVAGNNDGPELHARLGEVARIELESVRVAVVHETGASTGRTERMAREYPDVDLLIFGHSHIPWDTTAATGLRMLNPGSPTDRRRQPAGSFMIATITAGAVTDVELRAVGR